MKRSYSLGRRAEAKTASTGLILEAAERLFSRELYEKVSLNRVAAEAGMGVQTVLRHFPTKEALFMASMTHALDQADRSRPALPGETLAGSVQHLLSYYERYGATVIHYLDQVATNPLFAPLTRAGREAHARWTEVLFSPHLDMGKAGDTIRQAQIEAILDVRVWELLRLRKGLSMEEVSRVMLGLLEPFCA